MRNDYTDYLRHGLFNSDGSKKQHKYIERIKTGAKTWKYFYDMASYNAFKRSKEERDQIKQNQYDREHNTPAYRIRKQKIAYERSSKAKAADEAAKQQVQNDIYNEKSLPKKQRKAREEGMAAEEKAKNETRENVKNYREKRHALKKESDAVFEKALKRLGYDLDDIKKEPENMKDTVEHINRDYDPKNYQTSQNCSYCTSAFDLRRRGYDVEAARIETMGKDIDSILSWYDGAELKRPGTLISDEDYLKYYNSNGRKIDVKAKQKQAEKVADDMAKSILDDMGKDPESNGHVLLMWMNGGGHDITYFVSNDKKVHYYDNQINNEIDITDYLLNAYSVDYFRSDDKALNESVLETAAIDRGRVKKR